MAKDKKVEQITDMEVDFAQWYTDICRKAELVEYASVKGFTILRPYGYAICGRTATPSGRICSASWTANSKRPATSTLRCPC